MDENLEKPEVQNNVTNGGSKGLSIAALVLGIISLVFCFLWFISIPSAILAVIFGIIGSKRAGRGMAISGIATGIVSLIITIIIIIVIAIAAKNISDVVTSNEFRSEWSNLVKSYNVTLED